MPIIRRSFGVIALILSSVCAASSALADSSPYDGTWNVTLTCPHTAEGRADGFSLQFPARVADGAIHGERGTAGEPGWMQLDGPINPNGSANLVAEGVTDIPSYALYNVQKGTHYKHAVQAQFDREHGTGSWTTIRTCTFAFERR